MASGRPTKRLRPDEFDSPDLLLSTQEVFTLLEEVKEQQVTLMKMLAT